MSSTFRKITASLATAAIAISCLFTAMPVAAQDLLKDSGLEFTANASGIPRPEGGLGTIMGRVIGGVITIMGSVFLALIVYGGFLWMTAQGNEEKVKKAKQVISGSIIGIVIIFASYTIVGYVIDYIVTPTVNAPQEAAPPPAP